MSSQPGGPRSREAWRGIRRSDPWVAGAISRWRDLTGGGARTLIACSGGADSVALLLLLRSVTPDLVCGHVLHDLRERGAAIADRDCAASAAGACGVAFEVDEVRVPLGNAEAEARRVRYAALARIAEECGCEYVASGHHAGDQLEGVVMALVRGAGPRGLGGARETRTIRCDRTGASATLVRPLLLVEPAELRRACAACGVAWREDATNWTADRVRSALRVRALREIQDLRPGAAGRAARSAEILRDAAGLIEDRAQDLFGEGLEWDRASLRPARAVVIAAGLREAFSRLTGGEGLDRLGGDLLDAVTAAVRDASGEKRRWDWPSGVRVVVGKRRVKMSRRAPDTPEA